MDAKPVLIPGAFSRGFVLLVSVMLLFLVCPKTVIGAETVWQIGTFDHSSGEFSGPGALNFGNTYPQNPVVFIAGKSVAKTDWPSFQPGTSNGKAGHHAYPYTIEFNLSAAPKGLYILKVGLLNGDGGRLSILQIEVNDQRGWFYQHPQFHDVPGDKYWDDTIEAELPTAVLKQGTNKLVLTAIDDPASIDDFTDPGLAYDALDLEHDPGQSYAPGKISVQAEPTVFYQEKGNQLVELVDVYVRHNMPSQKARVALSLGGNKFSSDLPPDHAFGEERIEFAVPEFAANTAGEITATIGRHSQRSEVKLTPAKKWTVLMVPHVHIDVGFTDYQPKVAEIQSRLLDEAMQMIQDHPDFRYSTDGYWAIKEFMAGRNEEDRKKLLQMVRDHKIFTPAEYVNLLTEFPAVETLIRSLYPSYKFDRKNGANFDYANITDVPSQGWSYASVLAASGLKYFLSGSNQGRGPILTFSDLEKQSPYWWQGPDGNKVLMWYAYGYGTMSWVLGMPPTVTLGHDVLPRFLQRYTSPEYKSSTVLLYGAQGENSDLFPQHAAIAGEWNKVYAYPRLSYSGVAEAMSKIAGELGDSIPVIKGDGGPYWEDGIYSDTQNAILARKTEQRAPSAEKISTISSLVHPNVQPALKAIKDLWQNMVLFDEHTWGAWQSISGPESDETLRQLAVKDAFAIKADQDLDYVMQRGMAAIADYIDDPKGTLVVFNPLNWQRSGFVEIDLQKGIELVDQVTGEVVPYQTLYERPTLQPELPFSFQRIRFVARDIPALGYKTYSKRPAKGEQAATRTSTDTTLENAYYRVVLDAESGSVSSIFDKQLNKELVNASSPYRFDQYLYVTGGDQPSHTRLLYCCGPDEVLLPTPELQVHQAHGGKLVSTEHTPFGLVAHLQSTDTNTPQINTDVILFDAQKKIEFINHVQKEKVYTKEAVYFAFPFAADDPQIRYDQQNGVEDPTRDLLPGADREWFSLQHWASFQSGDVTAAIIPEDAELFTMGDIVRGKWPLELGSHRGTMFSYVMNNYWWTNYVAGQGGDFTFRYVVTSAKNLEPVELSRLGWEEMTPLESNEIIENDKAVAPPRPLDKAHGNFLQVNQPNVVLVNWKAAEDGHGTILRFLEVGGNSNQVEVQVPILQVQSAWMCNAMEENQQSLTTTDHALSFSVKPFQIVTVRVEGTPTVH